ncbi:hypothetical protein [[Phormidium ambiguum] IAM M-71]|nr:hypothetical protein [Phormidium ambiguum]
MVASSFFALAYCRTHWQEAELLEVRSSQFPSDTSELNPEA